MTVTELTLLTGADTKTVRNTVSVSVSAPCRVAEPSSLSLRIAKTMVVSPIGSTLTRGFAFASSVAASAAESRGALSSDWALTATGSETPNMSTTSAPQTWLKVSRRLEPEPSSRRQFGHA
jgi:hypothetical protein